MTGKILQGGAQDSLDCHGAMADVKLRRVDCRQSEIRIPQCKKDGETEDELEQERDGKRKGN
jgi:hypothetical protein